MSNEVVFCSHCEAELSLNDKDWFYEEHNNSDPWDENVFCSEECCSQFRIIDAKKKH